MIKLLISQKLIYLKINTIIPEVVFEGYNDVVVIVVGIVIIDSICFVVVVFCINESVWFDTDVAEIWRLLLKLWYIVLYLFNC